MAACSCWTPCITWGEDKGLSSLLSWRNARREYMAGRADRGGVLVRRGNWQNFMQCGTSVLRELLSSSSLSPFLLPCEQQISSPENQPFSRSSPMDIMQKKTLFTSEAPSCKKAISPADLRQWRPHRHQQSQLGWVGPTVYHTLERQGPRNLEKH